MMEWIEIKDEKPAEFESVLVAQHTSNDPNWVEYFIAEYWIREKQWIMNIHFPNGLPYTRIYRKIKKDDKWTYIYSPLED